MYYYVLLNIIQLIGRINYSTNLDDFLMNFDYFIYDEDRKEIGGNRIFTLLFKNYLFIIYVQRGKISGFSFVSCFIVWITY